MERIKWVTEVSNEEILIRVKEEKHFRDALKKIVTDQMTA